MFGYTTYFFQLAGVDDPFLGNMVKQMVLVVGIIIAFYTVDKVGRRTLVIYGGAAMATICLIVGGLGFMEQTSASGMALVALCSLWAFVYANTLAPIGMFAARSSLAILTDLSRLDQSCRDIESQSASKDHVCRRYNPIRYRYFIRKP